jgi:N-acetylglucosaminyldiphosphoundecaprenol N-acetyl-beta-D-mannosaminyltransferase
MDTMETAGMVLKKYSLFGVYYAATDYEEASSVLVHMAALRTSYTFSALAVHGLVEARKNAEFLNTVNSIDMVVPDGQPVRWALNSFYHLGLKDRVYGPDLALHVLRKANQKKLKVYLYGSTQHTLEKLTTFITTGYPDVEVCGAHPDRFREATAEEDLADIAKINGAGANIVLVGRGCPRQEAWVNAHKGKINAVMLAIGAAFDFHAQVKKQAPVWMRNNGVEWLFRLIQEPGRLWKRYLVTNSIFIYLFVTRKCFQALR